MKALLLTIVLLVSSLLPAGAASCADYGLTNQQPWVAYGGANIGGGQTMINPPVALNGLRGEVALPYMVPSAKVLVFEGATVQTLWGIDLVPFISPTATLQVTPVNALDTYTAGPVGVANPNWNNRLQTQQFSAGYQIPAGLTLNVAFRVSTAVPSNYVFQYEWSLHGFLCNS